MNNFVYDYHRNSVIIHPIIAGLDSFAIFSVASGKSVVRTVAAVGERWWLGYVYDFTTDKITELQ